MIKKIFLTIVFTIQATLFSGCLVPEKIFYTIKLDRQNSGTVTMQFYNIKSNSGDDKEFQDDEENLFNYILKSDKLTAQLKSQGKDVISRELYVDGDRLNGKAEYRFTDINKVEGIRFEDGFYYLTLALDDSVISTNGQIIKSKEYKRILWDKSIKTLKFEMYSSGFDENKFRALAPFYKSKE